MSVFDFFLSPTIFFFFFCFPFIRNISLFFFIFKVSTNLLKGALENHQTTTHAPYYKTTFCFHLFFVDIAFITLLQDVTPSALCLVPAIIAVTSHHTAWPKTRFPLYKSITFDKNVMTGEKLNKSYETEATDSEKLLFNPQIGSLPVFIFYYITRHSSVFTTALRLRALRPNCWSFTGVCGTCDTCSRSRHPSFWRSVELV